jgi:hypothetical protein
MPLICPIVAALAAFVNLVISFLSFPTVWVVRRLSPCLYVVCCLIWFGLTAMTPLSGQIYLTTCTTISNQDLATRRWRNHASSPRSSHQPPTSRLHTLHPSPPLQTNPSSAAPHPISQLHPLHCQELACNPRPSPHVPRQHPLTLLPATRAHHLTPLDSTTAHLLRTNTSSCPSLQPPHDLISTSKSVRLQRDD